MKSELNWLAGLVCYRFAESLPYHLNFIDVYRIDTYKHYFQGVSHSDQRKHF